TGSPLSQVLRLSSPRIPEIEPVYTRDREGADGFVSGDPPIPLTVRARAIASSAGPVCWKTCVWVSAHRSGRLALIRRATTCRPQGPIPPSQRFGRPAQTRSQRLRLRRRQSPSVTIRQALRSPLPRIMGGVGGDYPRQRSA